MAIYEVRFDGGRIGRTHDNPPLRVETSEPPGTEQQTADQLAEAVFRHARTRLNSRSFEVTVNLTEGHGSIEYGRFGSFTVELRDSPRA